jgi:hypothetical protein
MKKFIFEINRERGQFQDVVLARHSDILVEE